MKNMLEKNEKKSYFDAHFHYFDCKNTNFYIENDNIFGCSCAHSKIEWENSLNSKNIHLAFGIHPQNINDNETELETLYLFLKNLCEQKKLSAIGEIGIDLFTDSLKKYAEQQESYFFKQLELAASYNLPVIIHSRKANEKLFEYSKELKKLPAVLFHSFSGTYLEALSLINKGINAYFSFGKQIFNNNKKVIQCVSNLPIESLLLETDAPFQYLKDEKGTYNTEIIKVYEGAYKLRNTDITYELFCKYIEENYKKVFCNN